MAGVPGSLVGVISAFDERHKMALPASLTRRSDVRRGHRLVFRLLALIRAPRLDADLGAGVSPSTTYAHRLRADHLRRTEVRRRIATALERAAEDVKHPVRHGTPQAPLDREAVHGCEREIRALANSVARAENPRTQGVALAFQLAFDGGSALFFHPDASDGIDRLANTVRSAQNALRVSADFDE
jgi:hypothetical protein